MDERIIQEYELSVWEDVLGTNDHYTEQKIAVIGSDSLDTPIRAYNVALKEKINGEKILTFDLPRKYMDEDGNLKDNPFLSMLVAERKLKLRDGSPYSFSAIEDLNSKIEGEDRWYDFLIKGIDEDSENLINKYTCQEAFTDELGKNGYAVVLDAELENNYGTLTELGNKILVNSGWTIEDTVNPTETIPEPLFVATLNETLEATKVIPSTTTSIARGSNIYLFYSEMEMNREGNSWVLKNTEDPVQFLYAGRSLSASDTDDNRVVIDYNLDYNYECQYADISNLTFAFMGGGGDPITDAIQGNRIVKGISSHYEPIAGKYVYDYTDESATPKKTVYCYNETSYLEPTLIKNYVVNSKNFVSILGWSESSVSSSHIGMDTYPSFSSASSATNESLVNYLTVAQDNDSVVSIYNSGLKDNKINLINGQNYVVRLKARLRTSSSDYTFASSLAELGNITFTLVNGSQVVSNSVDANASTLSTLASASLTSEGYLQNTSENYRVLTNNIGIDENNFLVVRLTANENVNSFNNNTKLEIAFSSGSGTWYIKEVQLLPEHLEGNKLIFPEDVPQATLLTKSYFYEIEDLPSGVKRKKIIAEGKSNRFTPIYREGYAACRSLSVKESNYFNNINNLAELFNVWPIYHVHHCKNGRVFLENGVPKKTISFKRYSPDDLNYAGFKYGINEKSIKRTIDSKAAVTKLIVKDNNNEFAQNGMASISRASSNMTRGNVIYNFDYYANQGLLGYNQILRDLYGLTTDDLGYLGKVSRFNQKLQDLNAQLVANEGEILSAEEFSIYAQKSVESAQDLLVNTVSMLNQLKAAGISENSAIILSKEAQCSEAQGIINEMGKASQNYAKHYDSYTSRNVGFSLTEDNGPIEIEPGQLQGEIQIGYLGSLVKSDGIYWYEYDGSEWDYICNYTDLKSCSEGDIASLPLSVQIEYYTLNKQDLDLIFYKKYSQFIKEGTWTDEKYIDDELFYLDAVKVSSQNAYPKVNYNISVIDIENIPEYAAYKFRIGDYSTIEDPEFFGYQEVTIGAITTKIPFRKEVIVSERFRNFDDPSKSTITIKTYRNNFEELFSKIVSTTQSLQYASGEYQRAADSISPSGELEITTLEKAMENNAFILSQSKNQLVTWSNGDGIEVSDAMNSLNKLRITSNGIMMTRDGGNTWINGITGLGINTNYLVSGNISTDKIVITGGKDKDSLNTAFIWNEEGLDAYSNQVNDLVRYNQYGIYGTDQKSTLLNAINSAGTLDAIFEAIENYSTFALTYKGLSLKSQDGAVSITPAGGLEIFDKRENSTAKFTQDFLDDGFAKWDPTSDPYSVGDYIPLVSLGKFYLSSVSDLHYGLLMRNNDGEPTMFTDNSGNLWLSQSLSVGSYDGSSATAGLMKGGYAFWGRNGDDYNFSVDLKGTLAAKNANITGTIYATSGAFTGIVSVNDSLQIGYDDKTGTVLRTYNSNEIQLFISQDGRLFAKGAEISGTIAAGGISFSSNNGLLDDQGIHLGPGSDIYNFTVDTNGDLFANTANFAGIGSDEDGVIYGLQLGKLSNGDDDDDTYLRIQDKNKHPLLEAKADGTLNLSGKMTAGELIVGNSEVGNIKINGEQGFIAGILKDSTSYNWKISNDGTAEFNNATIRGKLSTVIFEKQKVSAVGGQLLVSPTLYLEKPLEKINSKFTLSVNSDEIETWKNSSITISIDGEDDIVDIGIDENLTFSLDNIEILPIGTAIIKTGSTGSGNTSNLITISANSTGTPFIKMEDFTVEGGVVLGDLSAASGFLRASQYFGALTGQGLYADNAYLTGKLYLPNAGITNETDENEENSPVRIWAGASPTEKNNAPFRVTQDGSLYASKGIFSGSLNVEEDSIFRGTIMAAGIKLYDNETEDNESDDHFYITYNTGNREIPDYILDIDQYGLNIYDGGLNIYSDYYEFNYSKWQVISEQVFKYNTLTTYSKGEYVYYSISSDYRAFYKSLSNDNAGNNLNNKEKWENCGAARKFLSGDTFAYKETAFVLNDDNENEGSIAIYRSLIKHNSFDLKTNNSSTNTFPYGTDNRWANIASLDSKDTNASFTPRLLTTALQVAKKDENTTNQLSINFIDGKIVFRNGINSSDSTLQGFANAGWGNGDNPLTIGLYKDNTWGIQTNDLHIGNQDQDIIHFSLKNTAKTILNGTLDFGNSVHVEPINSGLAFTILGD